MIIDILDDVTQYHNFLFFSFKQNSSSFDQFIFLSDLVSLCHHRNQGKGIASV